jgi:hypothetical protein
MGALYLYRKDGEKMTLSQIRKMFETMVAAECKVTMDNRAKEIASQFMFSSDKILRHFERFEWIMRRKEPAYKDVLIRNMLKEACKKDESC